MNIRVRDGVETDMAEVFRLAKCLATSFVIEEEGFARVFAELLASPSACLLVAEVDDTIIGYSLGFDHSTFYANGRVAWVEEIFVVEEYRRNRVGDRLMQGIERWARQREAALLALATRRASSFYKALGYEESAVYFRKILS
jgi:GNAT superfamily N-acetyltransferase